MFGRITSGIRIYTLIFLALLTVAIWSVYLQEPDDNLHVYFFDVGQGDAELIQKGNYQLLVDGGPDSKIIERLSSVMPIEDREIEKIILTHPHADHLSGLNDILDRYKVDEVVYNEVTFDSNVYETFKSKINQKKIKTKKPRAGSEEEIISGIKIKYIWPDDNVDEYADNINDTSIVFRLADQNFSVLFTGDCETECWSGILSGSESSSLKSNVLKVAHHGSDNGTTELMLDKIKPAIAIISLGKDNKYGFPHQVATSLLQKIGADIYRTDQKGTVDLKTDGYKISIE
jgi:competence protein ComEC